MAGDIANGLPELIAQTGGQSHLLCRSVTGNLALEALSPARAVWAAGRLVTGNLALEALSPARPVWAAGRLVDGR